MANKKTNTKPKAKKKKIVAKKPPTKKKRKALPSKYIVVTSPINDSKITIASELADDAIIEKQMVGEVVNTWIYRFCPKRCDPEIVKAGKCQHDIVTGLSMKGVNEVVRRLSKNPSSGSKIRINPTSLKSEEKVLDGQKGIEVSVFAEDLLTGHTAFGIKFEPFHKAKRDGSTYRNDFATEKALSKAERNAQRKLIPESLAIAIITKILKENPEKVAYLQAPKTDTKIVTPSKPVPSTPDEIANIILSVINSATDKQKVIEFGMKAEQDKRLTPEIKARIKKICGDRIKILGVGSGTNA